MQCMKRTRVQPCVTSIWFYSNFASCEVYHVPDWIYIHIKNVKIYSSYYGDQITYEMIMDIPSDKEFEHSY